MKNWFGQMQKMGKALMLPIAVLPAAALLLRLGAPDVLNLPFITQAGGAIFNNLALLFAIGIGLGIAEDENGAAALAGAVCYLVFTTALKTLNKNLDLNVLAGIISGLTAGYLYNRFHTIKLPQFLGFFNGRRFVPLVTAFTGLILALIFSVIWGPCQQFIQSVGKWIIGAGAVGVFIYGFLNRLLIPVGLHYILNSFIWFVFGEYPTANGIVTGDMNRFFAGDPTAGNFMAGFYIVMMFGLPAVALALYRTAPVSGRKKIAGMLFSVAFTSFLTGITEPLEFMFMFLAPLLYLIHAVLTGLAMVAAYETGILHGFSFSAGFIDYVLNWHRAAKPWLIIPWGLGFWVIYYLVFTVAIQHFHLLTLESGKTVKQDELQAAAAENTLAANLLACLGGKDNLVYLENCMTRLRLEVREASQVNKEGLKKLGAKEIFQKGSALQVVWGLDAENIAHEINQLIKTRTEE